MTPDTDPMLGDEPTQKAYADEVMKKVDAEIEADKQARLNRPRPETPAVLIGATGFGRGQHVV